MVLFLNPTEGIVNVKYNIPFESILRISDITGRMVMKIILPASNEHITQIDLSNFTSGLYTYELTCKKESLKTGKINKQ